MSKGYCLECGELNSLGRENLCNRCLIECTLEPEQAEEIFKQWELEDEA